MRVQRLSGLRAREVPKNLALQATREQRQEVSLLRNLQIPNPLQAEEDEALRGGVAAPLASQRLQRPQRPGVGVPAGAGGAGLEVLAGAAGLRTAVLGAAGAGLRPLAHRLLHPRPHGQRSLHQDQIGNRPDPLNP